MAEENWVQMIIWDFSYLRQQEGENCSHHKESNKQKHRGNCCGQETSRGKAVYPLVSMEATELLRKGTKSAARVRSCRLRPRSSRSWRSHRLTVTGSNSQTQVSMWPLSLPRRLCAVLLPCPSLQLSSLQLLLFFKDYWKPSVKHKIYWLGAVCKL